MDKIIEYIPIVTTIFAIYFAKEIFGHYKVRRTNYLLWWAIGVVTYGLGTLTESINALFGWSILNLKSWYIVGALLGALPLAQGSVYLLMSRRFANTTSYFFVSLILIAAISVVFTPVDIPKDFNYKLTGTVFEWRWVRFFSPLINLYSFVFLVGGAFYSAVKYYQTEKGDARFKGNILIAIGGILPGIGGTFTRIGYVNVLFVTELLGLVLIYIGYRVIKTSKYKSTIDVAFAIER